MKKLTTRTIAIAAAVAFVLNAATAAPEEPTTPDAATVAAAKTLMETLKVKEQMGPVMEGVKQMQESMIEQQELSDDDKAAAREIMAASMEEVEKAMSWDNLENLMVRVYAGVFSTAELEDLDALFKQPAGQKFIEKQPKLQAATMKEMQSIMVEMMPKIQKSTQAAIERIKNKQAPQN